MQVLAGIPGKQGDKHDIPQRGAAATE